MTTPTPPTGTPLPLLDAPPPLRADAERNRVRLLDAAFRLMSQGGVANLTMEAVAAEAGVGKGTVFRRFGDRAGLLIELLSHREKNFQAAFLSGPPPLGPGAPAVERLHAFGPALLRHEGCHRDLILASRTDPVRQYGVPGYGLRTSHLTMLLREAGADGDLELIARTLLSSLDTALVAHLTAEHAVPLDRLDATWHHLVAHLVPESRA
ncbi:helix-turn-helix domain-containing protein [Actinocorallia sp. A-T 12471]|uniref:TetR/AcrR family transcriptional regulator n=1 Tax=Actinocorallia sp. A-T 12471 TaxID=3089813 RepID=UPI0029CB74DD|nr:helix-turn-helix domain-containing protein [Actinocorallia sp. A-T 12471]MDX6740885.1 helix-turn-helix domain-containing protein [Actinocorallia sp. A-T 12471]